MSSTNLSRIALTAGRATQATSTLRTYAIARRSGFAGLSTAATRKTSSIRASTAPPTHVRMYATGKFRQATISESQYHELANTCLDALTDSLEALVEDVEGPEADAYEADYSSGVINLRLGSHGTYVINKQPPNKQIWFSSPTSGPKRFDYDAERKAWFMLKDGQESDLRDLLNSELTEIFGKSVEIDLGDGGETR